MTDEEPADPGGVVESIKTALGGGWETLAVTLEEIAGLFEPTASAWIQRPDDPYDLTRPVTVYVVSPDVLHRFSGPHDELPAPPTVDNPAPGSAITTCASSAVPITKDWTYELSLTRTGRSIGSAVTDRQWTFAAGSFGTLNVEATLARQWQSDPDPGVFARALAHEIIRAQARERSGRG